jgi:hypothetical protein
MMVARDLRPLGRGLAKIVRGLRPSARECLMVVRQDDRGVAD